MSNNSNIEQQFKNAFEHFEADVNTQLWTGIEQSLPGATTPVADASSLVKSVVGTGKLSLITIGITATVITAIIAVSYLVSNNSKPELAISTDLSAEKKLDISASTSINCSALTKEKAPLSNTAVIIKNSSLAQSSKTIETAPLEKQGISINNVLPPAQVADIKTEETVSNNTPINKKNTDPDTSISSADEKHENISSPAIETVNLVAAKASTNESFDWGVIPNAFSPNTDGKNDVFKITNPNIETIKVTIIDRNGKQVHEWNGINGFWDGKDLNGYDLPKGIYYYFIFAASHNGEALKTKGSITLLR